MKYRIYYINMAKYGMYDDIEATSVDDAIFIFKQQNRGCEITSVKKL